jgi:tetratricopeptide (TPR) repeat protein
LFAEIVIVDTGSHDATRAVARQFTPRVVDFPWCDDFSAARNETLRHATGDWVFWLDADDRLSPETVARLKQLLTRLSDAPQVYFMDTVCRPVEVGDPERLLSHPRLFRRHPQLAWQGRVHEQLRPCPSTLGYELLHSDVRIDHLGYSDAALLQKKLQRDVRLLRMDYAVNPDDPSTLLHLGVTHAQLGKLAEARNYLTRLMSLERRPFEYLRRVYAALAEISLQEGAFPAAVGTLHEALQVFPGDAYLMYLLSEALYELDHYAAAEALLVAVAGAPEMARYHAGSPHELKRKLAPRSLGEVLRIQRRLDDAAAVLRRVVETFPDDTLSWHALGRVAIDRGSRAELDLVRQRLERCPQGRTFSLLLEAAWKLMRSDFDGLEQVFHELIGLAPRMAMPRIMRAQWLARSGAPISDQLQACRDVLRVHPGHPLATAMIAQLEPASSGPPSAAGGPAAQPDWGASMLVSGAE